MKNKNKKVTKNEICWPQYNLQKKKVTAVKKIIEK
jgi:hypothetical protein